MVPPPVQVAAAAKKPVVLVTMTAVPLDLSDILANPKVGTKKPYHSHSNGPFFLLGWREVREVREVGQDLLDLLVILLLGDFDMIL